MADARQEIAEAAARGAAIEVLRRHWPTYTVDGWRCGCGAQIDVLGYPAHQVDALMPVVAAALRFRDPRNDGSP